MTAAPFNPAKSSDQSFSSIFVSGSFSFVCADCELEDSLFLPEHPIKRKGIRKTRKTPILFSFFGFIFISDMISPHIVKMTPNPDIHVICSPRINTEVITVMTGTM